jgi:Flp pilus assembly protein TadD
VWPLIAILLVCMIGAVVYWTRPSSEQRVLNRADDRGAQTALTPTPAMSASGDAASNRAEPTPTSGVIPSDGETPLTESSTQQQEKPVEPVQQSDAQSARFAQSAANGTAVNSLVAAVIAGDHAQFQQMLRQIKTRPIVRGERRVARQLNDEGLALFREKKYKEAASAFTRANRVDTGDAEIKENLGHSLLKAGDLAEAERALLSTLEIGPERASAWGSLGHIYAKRGKHREAVALLLTAYRYAPDKKQTLNAYSEQAAADDDPKVRAMLAESVNRLSNMQ